MSKQTEKLKKQLIEFSEVVNLFQTEAVQVKVFDMLFDSLDADRAEHEGSEYPFRKITKHKNGHERAAGRKKPGATKVLNQLLASSDFFDTQRSISSIADYCKENYDSDFKTSELSGILLKLANENRLRRERNDINKRFEYVKA